MYLRFLPLAATVVILAGCGADPGSVDGVHHYTGLALCDGTKVNDLTTPEERETVPGFSYHVAFRLDAACQASFRRQLAELPGNNCPANGDLSRGCSVQDAYPKANKHTTITVTSLGSGQYDMRFFS
jgi:hypothetical protein